VAIGREGEMLKHYLAREKKEKKRFFARQTACTLDVNN
jgi:hypothetical protein